MYATNMDHFGHLINPDNFNTSLTRPEMFEIMTNLQDWQGRFIRPEYYDFVSGKNESLQVKLSCFFLINHSNCKLILLILILFFVSFEAMPGRFLVSGDHGRVLWRPHRDNGKIWSMVGRQRQQERRAHTGRLWERANRGHPHDPSRFPGTLVDFLEKVCSAHAAENIPRILPRRKNWLCIRFSIRFSIRFN